MGSDRRDYKNSKPAMKYCIYSREILVKFFNCNNKFGRNNFFLGE